MKTIAIMPIKLNNERCPGKNTRILGDKPLLQYELLTIQSTGLVDEIYVYCSSKDLEQFLPEGVHLEIRPKELDCPETNFTQIFAKFISIHEADIYVYAHATAPFITRETVKTCIYAVQSGEYDSAFCAEKMQDYLWEDGKALNFDAENIPRTQDLPIIYKETSGIYVFTKDVFLERRRRVGINPYIRIVSQKEAIDIDDPIDFKIAESFLDIDFEGDN